MDLSLAWTSFGKIPTATCVMMTVNSGVFVNCEERVQHKLQHDLCSMAQPGMENTQLERVVYNFDKVNFLTKYRCFNCEQGTPYE